MKIANLQNLVDELCLRIDDLGPETAADLPGRFTELAENLEESGCKDASVACLKAAELAGQVFREETEATHGQQVLARTMEEVRNSLQNNSGDPVAPAPAPVQMADEDVQLIQEFVEEASEHLAGFSNRLETLIADPGDDEALNGVIRGFHTITGMAGYVDLGQIKGLAGRSGELLNLVRNQEITLAGDNLQLILESSAKIKDLLQEVERAMDAKEAPTDDPGLSDLMQRLERATSEESRVPKPVPDTRPERRVQTEVPRAKTIKEVRGITPAVVLPTERKIPGEQPATLDKNSVAAPTSPSGLAPAPLDREPDAVVQIRAERLDRLVEAIGDLFVAESLVSQSEDLPRDMIPPRLAEDLENLNRACRQLQKIGTSLELVPVAPLLREMEARMGQLAAQLGKDVDLVTAGRNAELDQRLLARLSEPLAAILTQCIEVGIETDSARRLAAGKSPRARIDIKAIARKDHLVLEIQDDGTGRNEDCIADAQVRRAIEKMQATLAVAAEPGQGCKFIIRLPLNPNLTEGLIIKAGSERCILPAFAVLRLIRPHKKNLIRIFNQNEMVFFDGEAVPLLSLTQLFGQQKSDPDPSRAMVVVAEAAGRRIGLLAEELLGYQPIVVKKLNQTGRSSPAVAGAAITSDGGMALVLDVPHLVQTALGQETAEEGTIAAGVGQSDGG